MEDTLLQRNQQPAAFSRHSPSPAGLHKGIGRIINQKGLTSC